jgi:hypothetical protein
MSGERTEIDFEKHRTEWLKRLAVELEKTQQFFPTVILPDAEYPEWVRRVEGEVAGVLLPVAKVKQVDALTPKQMGALLGHSCAMAVWTLEWLFEKVDEAEVEAQNSTDERELEAEEIPDKLRFDKWYVQMRRVAKIALCLSVDQTYEDMSEFLVGYSNAFVRKPKTFKIGEMGSTSFEIYIFLLLFWRFVNQLKSVSQLHQVLVKIFSAHRVGDLKRIEKICQRIGLHYRKPGRPKKAEIIQTPA